MTPLLPCGSVRQEKENEDDPQEQTAELLERPIRADDKGRRRDWRIDRLPLRVLMVAVMRVLIVLTSVALALSIACQAALLVLAMSEIFAPPPIETELSACIQRQLDVGHSMKSAQIICGDFGQ